MSFLGLIKAITNALGMATVTRDRTSSARALSGLQPLSLLILCNQAARLLATPVASLKATHMPLAFTAASTLALGARPSTLFTTPPIFASRAFPLACCSILFHSGTLYFSSAPWLSNLFCTRIAVDLSSRSRIPSWRNDRGLTDFACASCSRHERLCLCAFQDAYAPASCDRAVSLLNYAARACSAPGESRRASTPL